MRTTALLHAGTAAKRQAMLLASVLLLGLGTLVATGVARAQSVPSNGLPPQALPVTVTASGDVATAEVKLGSQVLADLTLTFDDASGLSPSSLGVRCGTRGRTCGSWRAPGRERLAIDSSPHARPAPSGRPPSRDGRKPPAARAAWTRPSRLGENPD